MTLIALNKNNIGYHLVKKRWLWHLAYWAAYYLSQAWAYYTTVKYYDTKYLQFMLINEIFFIVMTYFTISMYRYFFNRDQYYFYFILGFTSWIIYLLCKISFQIFFLQSLSDFKDVKWQLLFWSNIAIYIGYFIYITMCKFFKENYIAQYFENEKKQEQLNAELGNLKAQIAPHFLFNTMNNFYGLAVEKSSKLPDLMLKLSDLLRYSLYETEKQFVLLTDEIKAIKNYVDLEKIRLEEGGKVSFLCKIEDEMKLEIAPLLLIVFIENAFKHSKTVREDSTTIYIDVKTEKDWLYFKVSNNFDNLSTESTAKGLGLQNVKRRINLIYGEELHSLETKITDNQYSVDLKIKLKNRV